MNAVIALALLGVAVSLRLFWLTADLETQILGVLPDDAFYYYEIALRLLGGEGVSFDGQTPTTGFHPLWLLIVTPLFAGSSFGDAAPIARVLMLSTLLAAAAAFGIFRFALASLGRALPALLLALAFSTNLWLVRESLNGLETMAALSLLILALLTADRLLEAPSPARALGLGTTAALSILARSDTAILLVALYSVLLLARMPWRLVLAASLPPCLAVVALVLGCLALTGSPLQSSAGAVPWLMHANWARIYGADQSPGSTFLVHGLRSLLLLGPVAGGALAMAILAAPLLRGADGRLRPLALRGLMVGSLALGLLGLHFVHGYIRLFPRTWYFAGWVVVAYAGLSVGMAAAQLRLGRPRWLELGLTIALVLMSLIEAQRTLSLLGEHAYPFQGEAYDAGLGLRELVPDGARVGAFNSGIIAYLSGAEVVNLDGVVNEDAARNIRLGSLASYLRERDIRYLVDYPVTWSQAAHESATGPYFGPDFAWVPSEEIERFDRVGVGFPAPDQGIVLRRFHWRDSDAWHGRVVLDLSQVDATRHLVGAWRQPLSTDGRRWIEPRTRSVSLRVPMKPGAPYQLVLSARRPPGHSGQSCSVSANGSQLGALDSASSEFARQIFEVPARLARKRGSIGLRGAGCIGMQLVGLELLPSETR